MEISQIVDRPRDVRQFSHERSAGVAEVAPSGRARLDTLARWTQDVAWADVDDVGLRELTLWLVAAHDAARPPLPRAWTSSSR